MKILLSYSKEHFDPSKKKEDHKYWGSSASILARTLYKLLCQMGDVTYIDAWKYDNVKGKKFDLFVGIYANFYKILEIADIKKSIFFAVNMHPKERNKILKDFVFNNRLSKRSFAGWDLMKVDEIEKGLKLADFILLAGNNETLNSYLRNGVPIRKIKTFNYGLDLPIGNKSGKSSKVKKYLYLSSDIGLRKGFDVLADIFMYMKGEGVDFHLDIVGKPSNEYYSNKLNNLLEVIGKKRVHYYGWLDSASNEFEDIVASNDYLVFPSLEEGQAGTVIDGMSRGLIPIVSKNSGIDFSPMGILELALGNEKNYRIMKSSAEVGLDKIETMKDQTREYYEEFHVNYVERLKVLLDNCVKGELYPLVTLVLPIFNKEKTIRDLLFFLDKACGRYLNCELVIIFDGCVDKTEEVVKSFFKKKAKYRIIYKTTPNIFEVKSNNLGMRLGKGKYSIIIQDDNMVYDKNFIFEDITFMDKSDKAVVVGNLAGVNYYPLGTKLVGKGQIAMNENEVYWRQDANTKEEFRNQVYEVDACMRGPLVFRKSFMEEHGYLDEAYVPLYQDDMDFCFRAKNLGYKVYCMMLDVENKALTQAKYSEKKMKFFSEVIKKNTKIFYSRWKIPTEKTDFFVNKLLIIDNSNLRERLNCWGVRHRMLINEYVEKQKSWIWNIICLFYVKLKNQLIRNESN